MVVRRSTDQHIAVLGAHPSGGQIEQLLRRDHGTVGKAYRRQVVQVAEHAKSAAATFTTISTTCFEFDHHLTVKLSRSDRHTSRQYAEAKANDVPTNRTLVLP